ncbi:hypothetical protein [Pseudodonghicola sp.]|uniref:hypothetical protein n=1 Tax=Pseudodonghicola sp. TaxID=1969463 RepID=UPI003A96DC4B
MSRTRYKATLTALVLGVLVGCTDGLPPTGGSTELSSATLAQGPQGKVQATAPPGYCIDRKSLRNTPRGGFALMARCDTLGVHGLFSNRRLALITVTTAPMGADDTPPTLADLRQSVAPSKVIETRRDGNLSLVRLAEDPGAASALAGEHWRGAFALNGQLVALAIYVPSTAPPLGHEAADLLASVANRTRAASPSAAAPASPTKPRPAPLRPRSRAPVEKTAAPAAAKRRKQPPG